MKAIFNTTTNLLETLNAKPKHIKFVDGEPQGYIKELNSNEIELLETLTGRNRLFCIDDVIVVQEHTPTPEVPKFVTNFQLKQALNLSGDRSTVEDFILASGDQDTIDGWQHASVFERDNELFIVAVANLGWTEEKVNELMISADTFK